MVQLQVDAVMLMFKKQLSAIPVIPIHDVNPRLTEIRETEQETLLNLLEFPRLDDVLSNLILESVTEHLVLPAKIGSQESVDKGNIVVNAPDLKDFLPSQAEFFVPGAFFFQIVAFLPFRPELPGVPAMLDIA